MNMVVLYSNGKKLGTWAEAERLFAEALKNGPVEFRDESGSIIAQTKTPICPWDPSLTEEKIEHMSREEQGIPLSEFWRKMGV
jgi:hypothetical protein